MVIDSYDSEALRILGFIHGKRDVATLMAVRFAVKYSLVFSFEFK
jgi:hypothetical protein